MNQLRTNQTESKGYFFTARELARLTNYRAAVAASFYSDQCDQQTESADNEPFRLQDLLTNTAQAA
jgi:hypothetical protein